MSSGKRSKKDPEYTENSARRCVVEDDQSRSRCKSLFTCCLQNPAINNENSSDFNPNEFDYIVEKLVIKRVPIGLFATPYDVYEDAVEGCHSERKPLVVSNPQEIYSIVPAVNSSLFYTSTNEAGVSGFPTRPSSKPLRFTRNEDVFGDDDPLNATTGGYSADMERRYREAESLNRFTALHPNLKESERPPKDPCPLNITKSRRSLAEEISEIAAKKERTDLHYERTRNEILTTGSVYTAQSGTSRELVTEKSALSAVEEIPTRDKSEDERSSSNRQRTANSSCFPFGWKSAESQVAEENDAPISRTEGSLDDVEESFGPSKNQNFTIAPVQVHYASPNLETIRKIIQGDRFCIHKDGISEDIDRKISISGDLETKNVDSGTLAESMTDGVSQSSEEPRIHNFAGTTLRWKIIIKHHPPGSPTAVGSSRGSNASKIPTLRPALRNVIEAKVHKEPYSKNDRLRQKK